jgi:ribosomal protein S18 acetylase RimI-like enzyme
MKIRPATGGDDTRIAELWTEGYCGSAPGERSMPYGPADVDASRAAGSLFVAEEETVVGVIACYPPGAEGRQTAEAGEAEISRLAVTEPFRGRGVGRALVRHSLQVAQGTGAEAVALWSRPHQTTAHRLYRSLDFLRVPERDGSDSIGERWVFRYRLDKNASG